METLGTLENLRRHPVKSMRGEDLTAAWVAFSGIIGDRVYAFVNRTKTDNFPWHTAREQHDMLLYQPSFRSPPAVELEFPAMATYDVTVRTPGGRTLAVTDEALRAELAAAVGYDVVLRFSEKGMHDARPLSIFGMDTVNALAAESGRALDPRRFRANFEVRWDNGRPFYEDELIGSRLKIGADLEVMIVKKDPRCVIITLDPDTATVHPEVLRTVAKRHQGCAGVYAAVLKEGVVRPGDKIERI